MSHNNCLRQSNIELLRIIAMLLVLVLHADFYSLGWPNQENLHSQPSQTIVMIVIECIAIFSVNVFISISGWFSIKLSLKGISSFTFQCMYFVIGIFIIMTIARVTKPDLQSIKYCMLLDKDMLWFVKAYLFLYIFAPILNLFIEKSSRKDIESFLIVFYILQTLYSIGNATTYINYGVSAFSFLGLYIFARYARIYLKDISIIYLLIFIFIPMITNTFVMILSIEFHIEGLRDMSTAFSNPLTVTSSISCVILFSKLKMKYSPVINSIASSTFAVYLLHQDPIFFDKLYRETNYLIYCNYNGPTCGILFLFFILFVFAFSILIDQPRKWMWSLISSRISFNRRLKSY